MILAFSHPGIVVNDLEAAREFYEKMFGFKVISPEGWSNSAESDKAVGVEGTACKGYLMAGHNCYLELFEYHAPEQTGPAPLTLGPQEMGIRHLAFYVDDCRKEHQRLLNLGGQVLGTPVPNENGKYVVYCRDPFGNIIELCEVPVPEENPTTLPGVNCLGDYIG